MLFYIIKQTVKGVYAHMAYAVVKPSKEIRENLKRGILNHNLVDNTDNGNRSMKSRTLLRPHISDPNSLKINEKKFGCIRGANQVFRDLQKKG